MADNLEPLEKLTDMFRKLDGVGKKSAARYAFCVLNFSDEEAAEFARAILAAKREIRRCAVCQNITTDEVCSVCASDTRDHGTVCVVEDPRAVLAIEQTRQYGGVYHVLHGTISPMRGVTPDKLTIKELLSRLSPVNADGDADEADSSSPVKEVILATNPTVEGEATAMYIAKLLTPLGIKITRIANGVPVGGDLEYADAVTLRRAMEGRYSIL
ncbi:MAG: recombination protein RecR [Ruminococcaceae bacterium]|jgi:recombination protein RecR|nr:recombination protein RecR [Oscillospiraceae bacterium]